MKKLFKLFTLALLLCSCIKETEVTIDTIIVNMSGHKVTYAAFGVHASDAMYENPVIISIEDGEQATERRTGMGGANVFPESSDSVHIVFDSIKALKYNQEIDPADTRSPYSGEGYTFKKIGENHSQYTYTITKEDYNNAIPIEEAGE